MMQKPPIDYGELVFDLANELRKGRSWYDAVVEICEDTGANEEVLNARFKKSYPNGLAITEEPHQVKLARIIRETCHEYGVPDSSIVPMILKDGLRVTFIARLRTNNFVGIRHDNFHIGEYSPHDLSESCIKYSQEIFRKDKV
jgi:hypothetical protein